jgi:hypothetical protein
VEGFAMEFGACQFMADSLRVGLDVSHYYFKLMRPSSEHADLCCRYGKHESAVTIILVFRTLGGLSSAGGSVTLGMVADMACTFLLR